MDQREGPGGFAGDPGGDARRCQARRGTRTESSSGSSPPAPLPAGRPRGHLDLAAENDGLVPWCGPTVLALAAGRTYADATAMLRTRRRTGTRPKAPIVTAYWRDLLAALAAAGVPHAPHALPERRPTLLRLVRDGLAAGWYLLRVTDHFLLLRSQGFGFARLHDNHHTGAPLTARSHGRRKVTHAARLLGGPAGGARFRRRVSQPRRRRSSRWTAPGLAACGCAAPSSSGRRSGAFSQCGSSRRSTPPSGAEPLPVTTATQRTPVRVRLREEAAERAMRVLRAPPVQVQHALRPGAAAPQVAPAPRVQPAGRGADAQLRRRARRLAAAPARPWAERRRPPLRSGCAATAPGGGGRGCGAAGQRPHRRARRVGLPERAVRLRQAPPASRPHEHRQSPGADGRPARRCAAAERRPPWAAPPGRRRPAPRAAAAARARRAPASARCRRCATGR